MTRSETTITSGECCCGCTQCLCHCAGACCFKNANDIGLGTIAVGPFAMFNQYIVNTPNIVRCNLGTDGLPPCCRTASNPIMFPCLDSGICEAKWEYAVSAWGTRITLTHLGFGSCGYNAPAFGPPPFDHCPGYDGTFQAMASLSMTGCGCLYNADGSPYLGTTFTLEVEDLTRGAGNGILYRSAVGVRTDQPEVVVSLVPGQVLLNCLAGPPDANFCPTDGSSYPRRLTLRGVGRPSPCVKESEGMGMMMAMTPPAPAYDPAERQRRLAAKLAERIKQGCYPCQQAKRMAEAAKAGVDPERKAETALKKTLGVNTRRRRKGV
jgi:hypothetical protein